MFLIPNSSEVKRRRLEQGLTMKDLSLKAGLPCNAVLRIENGTSKKTNHLRIQAIATALDCKPEDICEVP